MSLVGLKYIVATVLIHHSRSLEPSFRLPTSTSSSFLSARNSHSPASFQNDSNCEHRAIFSTLSFMVMGAVKYTASQNANRSQQNNFNNKGSGEYALVFTCVENLRRCVPQGVVLIAESSASNIFGIWRWQGASGLTQKGESARVGASSE
jgi:hypothetical protein